METINVGSTLNHVGRDQISHTNVNNTFNFVQPVGNGASSKSTPLRPFIDAPVDILTIHFTGRTDELARIKEILDAVGGNVPIRCVIHGMHGIGKTQLTLYFAISAFDQGRYQYILWISATTVGKLQQGIVKLLDLIDHKDRYHPEQDVRLTAARRWLEECDSKWLLVLDNVERDSLDFLREHLPRQNKLGNILFTTRSESLAESLANSAGHRHHTIELRIPNLHDAAKLLIEHFDGDVDEGRMSRAKDVAKIVGCLPLAVAQAGSFMKQSGKNLDEMLNLYRGNRKVEMINWENDLSNYEAKSVAAIFSHQLRDLALRYPIANDLLNILAFLDPENISLDMITEGSKTVKISSTRKIMKRISKSPDFTPLLLLIQSPVELQKAITQLENQSLIKHHRNFEPSALYVHDLIQFMIQENVKSSGAELQWFEFTMELVCGALARIEDSALPRNWPRCEAFIPHIRSLTARKETYGGRKSWSVLMDANERVAIYLFHCGRYNESKALLDGVLAWKEKKYGLQHLDTANTLHDLARVYSSQGQYKKAETTYDQVLAIREKKLGVENHDTLYTKSNLAVLYLDQSRYWDAEKLLKSVLASREKQLGAEHYDTLISKHNLAIAYESLGRYSDAETLYELVLAAREKMLGTEHPETLWTMNNLAIVYEGQGRLWDAAKLHERVLAIRKKLLGVDHPITLITMNNLAIIYVYQGRHDEGASIHERVLASREKQLGPEHPDTLTSMHNLALVFQSSSQLSDAETLYRRALSSREDHLGAEHSDTLMTLNNLANVYMCQGRYGETEEMHKRILASREKQLGAEHPHTLMSVHNLALAYQNQGQFNEAEIQYNRGLAGRETILGFEHIHTLMTMNNLANVYMSQGRHGDAEALHGRVLAGREKVLGVQHYDTIQSMNNLAAVYETLARHEDAQALRQRASQSGHTDLNRSSSDQHDGEKISETTTGTSMTAQLQDGG